MYKKRYKNLYEIEILKVLHISIFGNGFPVLGPKLRSNAKIQSF